MAERLPTMLFAKLYDEAGVKSEATARAAGEDGKLLPPGVWSVQVNGEQTSAVMAVEEMPPHWQRQINKWAEFGKRLGREGG